MLTRDLAHLLFGSRLKEKSSQRHPHNGMLHCVKRLVVLCVLTDSFLDMDNVSLHALVCQLTHCCANMWVFLWTTDLKGPYSLDRAEVMAYLRDVVKQSDESDLSEVRQHEPCYKKVS